MLFHLGKYFLFFLKLWVEKYNNKQENTCCSTTEKQTD